MRLLRAALSRVRVQSERSPEKGRAGARRRLLDRSKLVFCSLLLLCGLLPADAQETVFVDFGSSMLYLDNQVDPGIGMDWIDPAFDDSGWAVGQYGVGYENSIGAENLLLTVVPITTRTVYTRVTFDIEDVSAVQNLFLGVDFDDGYAAWINGVEVYRANLPDGTLDWNTPTLGEHESSNGLVPLYETQDISAAGIPALQNGQNVLAIGVWNIGLGSSDLVLVSRLSINKELNLTRGPYIQLGTPHSMVVRWRTSYPVDSRVEYGDAPGNLTLSVEDPTPTTEHEITVGGLDPETPYFYAVGTSAGLLAGDNADHFFITSPPEGAARPIRIWAMGDFGEGTADALAVRDAYYAYTAGRRTDLWLMLGDNAMPNGTDYEFQTKLFDVYPEILRQTVAWPTIGNHEFGSSSSWNQSGPYYDSFTMPTAGQAGGVPSGTEAYYSFDFGNIHFVTLDSYGTDRSVGGPMLTWLEADLASTTRDWIIAFWHIPPYSKGGHDSDLEIELIEMRENALPIIEDHGVDLVLSGHCHSYERSFLLDGHYGDSTTFSAVYQVDGGDGREDGDGAYAKQEYGPDPHSGTVYTVAGSGAKLSGGDLNHPAMYVSMNELGSVVLDVDDRRLDAAFLDSTGGILDYYTLTKGNCVDADSDQTCDDSDNCPGQPNEDQADSDSDGAGNACDVCPFDADDDIDSDGFCADADNCPWIANPTQLDTDLDGSGDLCDEDDDNDGVNDPADCAPLRRGVAAPPGPVGQTLRLDKFGGARLTWRRAYQGHTSNVYRARAGGHPTGDLFSCDAVQNPESVLLDSQGLSSGEIFFYLITGVNLCGEGSAGSDSLGYERGGWTPCSPVGGDFDVDGVEDLADNCAVYPNVSQADFDKDFVGDMCDNCAFALNPDQADCNGNGVGNRCDASSDCDLDTLADSADNCPEAYNPLQDDADTDGLGDACDLCVLDRDNDVDRDLRCGDVDNCPGVANPDQDDEDLDLLGNACDACPLDADNDIDDDTVCGDVDNCPSAPNTGQQDADTDAIGDVCDECTDSDGDNAGDPGFPANTCPTDNCPATFNAGQEDADTDTLGDACDACPLDAANDADSDTVCGDEDNCPATPNGGQEDADSDSLGDVCDNCPAASNLDQEDSDGDALGDACDACPLDTDNDIDSDGVCGDEDNCPTIYNMNQRDGDKDSIGDACDVCPDDPDNDADSDTVCGDVDNCPAAPNSGQEDADSDILGDVCDDCTDSDGDGAGDPGFPANLCPPDNCPILPNPDQADFDVDGDGDVCDDDDDNDGVADLSDCAPFAPGVAAEPDPIGNTLRLEGGTSTAISWLRSFQGHVANVYRGGLNPGQPWSNDPACIVPEVTGTGALDEEEPTAGALFFYLVSARNSCGESAAGEDGDGVPTLPSSVCPALSEDTDLDTIPDLADNCPASTNLDQADSDGDFVGNACDNCPGLFNPDQADADDNGQGDACQP